MSKRDEILTVAQELLQTRGYNGFSYADIAAAVNIRKASIHHHFPNKAELGKSLIAHYTTELQNALDGISQLKVPADQKLRAYIDIYFCVYDMGRVCLGGMLASDAHTLDESMMPALREFFKTNTDWIAEILSEGMTDGIFQDSQPVDVQAELIFSTLQGALLLARANSKKSHLQHSADMLMQCLLRKG